MFLTPASFPRPTLSQSFTIFRCWLSDVYSTIKALGQSAGFNRRTLKYEEIGDAVGAGSFACVAKLKDWDLVIKTPFYSHKHYMEVEKRVYERLGRHPFILRYYREVEVTSKGGSFSGLILQYHRAGTLEKSLQNPDYEDKRSGWPLQAAEAIQYIHSKKVYHGDVGVHNFLVQYDGTLALADFGGSSIDGSEYQEAGMPRYTRPTSAIDSDPTEMDDLFALGMVIYEIKTGQTAYADKSHGEIRRLLDNRSFPDLGSLPSGWRLLVNKCWQEEYNSAEELLIDLKNLSYPDSGSLGTISRPSLLLCYSSYLSATLAITVLIWQSLSTR